VGKGRPVRWLMVDMVPSSPAPAPNLEEESATGAQPRARHIHAQQDAIRGRMQKRVKQGVARRKGRWYWAAPAAVFLVALWRDNGPRWAIASVRGGVLLAAFVIWRHRNDPPASGHDPYYADWARSHFGESARTAT
jgi:hypothetical protein